MRGREISIGAKQIGQIDEHLDPSGLERENMVKKLLRLPQHSECTSRVAKGKKHTRIVGTNLQRAFEAIDRLGMAILTRKPEAFFIRVDMGRSGHGTGCAPAAVKSPLSTISAA